MPIKILEKIGKEVIILHAAWWEAQPRFVDVRLSDVVSGWCNTGETRAVLSVPRWAAGPGTNGGGLIPPWELQTKFHDAVWSLAHRTPQLVSPTGTQAPRGQGEPDTQ